MKLKAKDYYHNEIIKILREWTELNQYTFGKRIHKSARVISDYETGKSHCSLETFMEICREFDIEITIEKKPKATYRRW